MGYKSYRIRQKTSGSGFDTLHLESNTTLIKRFTASGELGETVETALLNLESGKMDLVTSVTDGHLATLNASGQVIDSGKAPADFAAAVHDHPYAGASVAGGAATTALRLDSAVTIDGQSFDGSGPIVFSGTCTSGKTVNPKIVAAPNFNLVEGATITVKFSNENTVSHPSLRVGSSEAKPIFYQGAAIDGSLLKSNDLYTFRYDGTNWDLVGVLNNPVSYDIATGTTDGLLSSTDKVKLDDIETGAQVNTITGIKGSAEASYRTGQVELTAANVGAAEVSHGHDGDDVELPTANRVVVTDANMHLAVSAITSTVLNYLSGLTGNVQTQLNNKAASDHGHDTVYVRQDSIGVASGVAPLGSDGIVPAAYLPSYVDDVKDVYIRSGATAYGAEWFSLTSGGAALTPETDKIYNVVSAGDYQNQSYRWSGTAYVRMNEGVALGETSSTAYRGDRGKIAYDHSQATHARTDATATAASTTNGNIKINGSDVTVYTHPSYTSKTSGMYKITVDVTGHVSGATAIAASDIKGLSGIDMTAASSSAAGTHGMVPAPAAGDQAKFLRGDGTWQAITAEDTKVNVTLQTTTKLYLLGTATTPTSSAQAVTAGADTGVYLDTTAGKLVAGSFAGDGSGLTSLNGSNITTGTVAAARIATLPGSKIGSGTVAVAYGGTGASSASAARSNLGVINVQYSSTQPTDQAAGDLWFEPLS